MGTIKMAAALRNFGTFLGEPTPIDPAQVDALYERYQYVYGQGGAYEEFHARFAEWGLWIILIKGLTPIPYKVVTIAAGIAYFNLPMFIVLSVLTRGARFFLLAFLLNRYGAQARAIIEKRLGFWLAVSAVTVVVGFVIVSKLL